MRAHFAFAIAVRRDKNVNHTRNIVLLRFDKHRGLASREMMLACVVIACRIVYGLTRFARFPSPSIQYGSSDQPVSSRPQWLPKANDVVFRVFDLRINAEIPNRHWADNERTASRFHVLHSLLA